MRRSHLIALLAILFVGAFLRLYQIEQKMRFIWDESRDMTAIYTLVADRNLTLFGPFNEVNGKKDFFGVFHYYLMAPSLWLTNYDPVGPAVFTALLGVISIWLVFKLVKKWSSPNVALATSLLYAVSPIVIEFVRWPWNPNTTPFFALLFFLTLTKMYQEKRQSFLLAAGAGLLLGLLFQLHYFTLVLGWPLFLVVSHLKITQKIKFGLLAVASLTFILPNLSFVLFDLTHNFFYFNIVKESFFTSSATSYFQIQPLTLLTAPILFSYKTLQSLGFGELSWLVVLLKLFLFWRIGRRYLETRTLDLSSLVASTYLLFLLGTSFFPALTDLYHLAYLWWGLLFILVSESKSLIKSKALVTFLIVGIGIVLALSSIKVLQQPPDWSQNMPLIRKLSGIVVNDLSNNPTASFNIAAFTDIDARAIRYRYFLIRAGKTPDGIDQYPESERIYIISPHDESATKLNPAWEIQSVRDTSWTAVSTESGVTVYRANN